jgi:hypothetical protein
MYQWSLIERQIDGPIACIGVYNDFEVAVGQMFLTINSTIDDHFYDEWYCSDHYKIHKLTKLECDAGYFIRLKLDETISGSNDKAFYIYYLLCSEKKG